MQLSQLVYLLPLASLWAFAGLGEPITMILIASTLFFAIKTQTLLMYRAKLKTKRADLAKIDFPSCLVWYSVWWGLKPSEFFSRRSLVSLNKNELLFVGAKILLGLVLITLIVPRVHASEQPLLAGWLGMVGIVFCMHFGYSHLSAVIMQSRGRNVTPIMNNPALAKTVSEFWGKRWNLAFRDYAHITLFMPLAKKWGAAIGALAGFAFSGVIHELAISVPARGGYGWPMLYFLIQGLAVLIERRMTKSGWLDSDSFGSRIWTIAIVALPAPLLFHQAFVLRVINPIVGWFALC